jgi:hypothetical protein
MLSRALKGLILIAFVFSVVAVGLFVTQTDKPAEAHTIGITGTHDDHFPTATISPNVASSSAVEREYTVTISNLGATTTHRVHTVKVDIPPLGSGGSNFNVISVTSPANWSAVLADAPFGSGVRTDTITWSTAATSSRIDLVNGASREFKFRATGPPTVTTYSFTVTITDDGLNAKTDAESDPATLDDDGVGSSTTMIITVENDAPTITSITTEDINRDGQVDSANIVFSENIDDSTLVPADWKIGGVAAFSIDSLATSSVNATGAADDRTVRVSLASASEITGTAVADVTHTAGSSATTSAADIGGNKLGAIATADVVELDGANPQISTIHSNTTSTIDVTFTEKITGVTVGDWDTTDGVVTAAATTSDAVLRLTLQEARSSSATTSLTYVVGDITDLKPGGLVNLPLRQEDYTNERVAVDKVAPSVTSGNGADPTVVSVATGLLTSAIDLTFSEWLTGPKSALTLTATDWAVAGNTVSSVATTTGWLGERTVVRLTLGSQLASNGVPVVTYTGASKMSDAEGNAVANFATTTTDKVGPSLLSVTWKDVTGNGTLDAGDTIKFIFNEEIASTTIAGALDGDLVPSAGTWGTGHGATWSAGTTTLTVTLAGTPTVVAGATVDPAAGVTDKGGNADITTANGGTAPSVVQVSLTLNPSATTRNKNQTLTVTVDIADVENLDALAYTLTFVNANLRYDSAVAGAIGSTAIPVSAVSTDTFHDGNGTSATVRISQNVAGTSGVTGSGTLATLSFTWIGNSGTSSALTLGAVSLSDKNSVGITANTTNTTITSTLVKGDANGDGTLNVADQTAVERIVAGLDTTTPGADATAAGGVNAQDITCTERLVAALTCP